MEFVAMLINTIFLVLAMNHLIGYWWDYQLDKPISWFAVGMWLMTIPLALHSIWKHWILDKPR